ncbi:MAG: hypothetical protein KAW02_06910 [candidate division Zixibacteria bacterium]|nr:hypothetical protein [candidate division Zixibacteria bacterium]
MSKSSKPLNKSLPKVGWLVKYQGELGVIIRVYPGKVVKGWAKDLSKTNKEKAKLRYGVTIGFQSKAQYFTSQEFENSVRVLSKNYNVGCLYALVRLDQFLFERLIIGEDESYEVSCKKEKSDV